MYNVTFGLFKNIADTKAMASTSRFGGPVIAGETFR